MVKDPYGNLFGIVDDGSLNCTGRGRLGNLEWSTRFRALASIWKTNGLLTVHKGVIYGACYETVFSLTHQADGSYTEKTLYTFKSYSEANVTMAFDTSGAIYGTTQQGAICAVESRSN